MNTKTYNVLFLCTGNSARSILAEAIMNNLGRGRFVAYSAGSHPTGTVNPFAIETLQNLGLPTEGLRSKAWDEFADASAPALDFVFTVCDNAAGEICPVWPGRPTTAHWGVEDPAANQGSDDEKRALFQSVAQTLRQRIEQFAALPIEALDQRTLRNRLQAIGRS